MDVDLKVSVLSMTFMVITLLISFAVPIGLLIYFKKKKRADISPFFIGCAIFVLFALVLESIMHQFILGSFTGIMDNIWLYGLYGGLAAGVFEETGRFVAMKFLMKKKLNPQNALMYGAGHGGIEAIILVGITYINNLVLSAMINSGAISALTGTIDQSVLTDSVPLLATTPSLIFLLGGVERLIAITIHISLSVLVYRAVTENKKRYLYPVAITIHAFIDFIAVVTSRKLPVIGVELVMLVCVIILAIYARYLYKDAVSNINVPVESDTISS